MSDQMQGMLRKREDSCASAPGSTSPRHWQERKCKDIGHKSMACWHVETTKLHERQRPTTWIHALASCTV